MENGLTINILYFARVAELVGKRYEVLPIEKGITGRSLLDLLKASYPQLRVLRQLYLSVNQIYAQENTYIEKGDEVAVFEAVTGG